ncbi:MAG: hypothetical protein ACE5KS_03785 [Woeseiaceae bacterium]
MSLEAFSTAASIALVSTFVFLAFAKSWHAITRFVGSATSFPGAIMTEPAQRFRDQTDRLTRRIHVYLSSALVFLVVFAVSYLLKPDGIFGNFKPWQLLLIVALLTGVSLYAARRFVAVLFARHRTRYLRDANIAAGHRLQTLTGNNNRIFHDVSCGAGIIDNVVVGLHGVYAVNVVARKPGKDNTVRVTGDTLEFARGTFSLSLAEFGQRSKALSREFRKILKHDVRVRSVIAVPGWEIDSQSSDEHLIVNERNLAMLRGWKDQNDYLMNEEVEKLQKVLNDRCMRS